METRISPAKRVSIASVNERTITPSRQYSIQCILSIWLAGGLPIWLLSWVAYPVLSTGLLPIEAGLLRLKLLTAGLVWEFVLSIILVYFEQGNTGWTTLWRRLKLNRPSGSASDNMRKAWLLFIALIILAAVIGLFVRPMLVNLMQAMFPSLTPVMASFEINTLYASQVRMLWIGAWGWFGLIFVSQLFNVILGEELLFRGTLLPRMNGYFGQWDWVANGLLFGAYHLHQPWGIPTSMLTGLIYAFAAKRFRSTWAAIILHAGQSVFLLLLTLGLVLGWG